MTVTSIPDPLKPHLDRDPKARREASGHRPDYRELTAWKTLGLARKAALRDLALAAFATVAAREGSSV